jgi:hypothetical protein
MPRILSKTALIALAFAPALCHAQAAVGELFSTMAHVRGSVQLAGSGTTVLSGSSIDAGEQPARLALNRGGNLVICQGTSVSVNASTSGNDLMFSFGSGTIEPSYTIGASSDVIVTPDFRFVITGPGDFDFDIGELPHGETCVRSRARSTGGIIVNEQMGDGTYQVKPGDSVVFHNGRVANASSTPSAPCGCPPVKESRVETQVAKAAPAPPPAPMPVAPSPTPSTKQEHVVAEAPFVFSSDSVAPPPTSRVMHLHVESNSFVDLHPSVQPPPAGKLKKKGGFWHKLKQLFS